MENIIEKDCLEAFISDMNLNLDVNKILNNRSKFNVGDIEFNTLGKIKCFTNNSISNIYMNPKNNLIITFNEDKNIIEFRFHIDSYYLWYQISYDTQEFNMSLVKILRLMKLDKIESNIFSCSIKKHCIKKQKQTTLIDNLSEEEILSKVQELYQDKEFIDIHNFIFIKLQEYYPNISLFLENNLQEIKNKLTNTNSKKKKLIKTNN